MFQYIVKETVPLNEGDCFTVFSGIKKDFDSPLHYHDEYELNLIINAGGAKRIIGDHIETIDNTELIFIGPNLGHTWIKHQCTSETITEITILFHRDLLGEKLLNRHQLSFIKKLLDNSKHGILFSRENTRFTIDRILKLNKKNGLDAVLELLSILNELSVSKNVKLLSNLGLSNKVQYCNNEVRKVFEHMHKNYFNQITLAEIADIANMPETSFSRFIKKHTGQTFVDSLNEIRLGYASKMLIGTTCNIAEIAYKCGFNNISNFNRIFKRKKACTPKKFREDYFTAGTHSMNDTIHFRYSA